MLSKARGLFKGNTNISCVYSDINCSLDLRFKDNSLKYFNSEKVLSISPTLTHCGGLFNQEVSTSASTGKLVGAMLLRLSRLTNLLYLNAKDLVQSERIYRFWVGVDLHPI